MTQTPQPDSVEYPQVLASVADALTHAQRAIPANPRLTRAIRSLQGANETNLNEKAMIVRSPELSGAVASRRRALTIAALRTFSNDIERVGQLAVRDPQRAKSELLSILDDIVNRHGVGGLRVALRNATSDLRISGMFFEYANNRLVAEMSSFQASSATSSTSDPP